MISIFETDDGYKTQEAMLWDFIKAIGETENYKLWHSAIVKEELSVHE